MVQSIDDVRPSPLAGKWYPGRAETLIAMMDEFLKAVKPQPVNGKLLGLLAPHAGYRYSGPVAAHAFALIQDMAFDTVVVIGPMHHPLPGSVLSTAHSAYETPLGNVPVDRDVLDAIGKRVRLTAVRNDPEHSVEIELPFLQHVLKPGFSLVPFMLRDQSGPQTEALGEALAETLPGRQVLLVASSDLSHFYPQEIANELDSTMLACVEAMDARRVVDVNERQTAFACGYGAIATVINVVRAWNADRAQIVGYGTSGDVIGDFREVVGYGAAMFYQAA
jgi:AmmeMemoRadiSam system protein B